MKCAGCLATSTGHDGSRARGVRTRSLEKPCGADPVRPRPRGPTCAWRRRGSAGLDGDVARGRDALVKDGLTRPNITAVNSRAGQRPSERWGWAAGLAGGAGSPAAALSSLESALREYRIQKSRMRPPERADGVGAQGPGDPRRGGRRCDRRSIYAQPAVEPSGSWGAARQEDAEPRFRRRWRSHQGQVTQQIISERPPSQHLAKQACRAHGRGDWAYQNGVSPGLTSFAPCAARRMIRPMPPGGHFIPS